MPGSDIDVVVVGGVSKVKQLSMVHTDKSELLLNYLHVPRGLGAGQRGEKERWARG